MLSPEKARLLKLVRQEVEAAYTQEEIEAFTDFEAFWVSVDTMNAYEEEWQSWVDRGIKEVYRTVFNEKRGVK